MWFTRYSKNDDDDDDVDDDFGGGDDDDDDDDDELAMYRHAYFIVFYFSTFSTIDLDQLTKWIGNEMILSTFKINWLIS